MGERLEKEQIAARNTAAKRMVGELIEGADFRMSVPARESDSDVVIFRSLDDIPALLRRVAVLEEEKAKLVAELEAERAGG